jgi:actin-related protein 3
MFEHFGQRLKRDLKKLVDQRIEASEISSKSLIRVCKLFKNSWGV